MHQSFVIAQHFPTDLTSTLLGMTSVLLVPLKGSLSLGELFPASVAAHRLGGFLGSSLALGSPLVRLRLLDHLIAALGLVGALLLRSSRLALHGEDLVDGYKSQIELFRLDLTLLWVLALHVAHEASLRLELPLASDTFKNGSSHFVRIRTTLWHLRAHRGLSSPLLLHQRWALMRVELRVLGTSHLIGRHHLRILALFLWWAHVVKVGHVEWSIDNVVLMAPILL